MTNVIELQHLRADKINSASALLEKLHKLDGVEKKDEALKAEITETKGSYDSLLNEAKEIAGRIAMQQEIESLKADLARPSTQPVKPELDLGPQNRFSSLGEQLQAVANACKPGGRLDARLTGTFATGMSEAVPADGGFLVQTDYATTLMQKVWQTGVLPQRCFRVPISERANGVKIPMVDETSRANGSRWGGVRAYWANEAATKTSSKPKLGRLELELEKLIGLCYMTDELLQDAPALEALVREWFALEFGFKLDDALVNGDGAGKPLGILNATALISVAKETAQAANTIVVENIVKMWSRMYGPSRRNGIWLINQDIEPQLFTMSLAVGTGGVPVYMPANGLSQLPYSTLMGRPVIPIEQCATLGTVGDIIFADFSQYVIIDKGGVQAASSIHVQFVTDETAFRFVYRVDGQPGWSNTLTPFKGTNTQSPFIALATRA